MKKIFKCEKCGNHTVTDAHFDRHISAELREKLSGLEGSAVEAYAKFGDGTSCPDCATSLNVQVDLTVIRHKK